MTIPTSTITPISAPIPSKMYHLVTPKKAKQIGRAEFQNELNNLIISYPQAEVQRRLGNRLASSNIMIDRCTEAIKQAEGDLKTTFKAQHAFWDAMGKAVEKYLRTVKV